MLINKSGWLLCRDPWAFAWERGTAYTAVTSRLQWDSPFGTAAFQLHSIKRALAAEACFIASFVSNNR
jgi:hypothetical protein